MKMPELVAVKSSKFRLQNNEQGRPGRAMAHAGLDHRLGPVRSPNLFFGLSRPIETIGGLANNTDSISREFFSESEIFLIGCVVLRWIT